METRVVGALLSSSSACWLLVSALELGEEEVEWHGAEVICGLLDKN